MDEGSRSGTERDGEGAPVGPDAPTEVIPAGASLFARPGSGARPPVDDAPTTELPGGAVPRVPPASPAPPASPVPPRAEPQVPGDETPTAVILNLGGGPEKPGHHNRIKVPIWRRWPVVAGAGVVVVLAATVGAIALSGAGGSPSAVESPAPVPSPMAFSLNPESARPVTPSNPGKRSSGAAKGASAAPTTAAALPRANAGGTNLALNRPVTASSSEGDAFPASAAVDGNPSTRWSSEYSDPQWISVDLGETWRVSEVRLVWERAYATTYEVDLSLDGTHWSPVFATNNGTGGTVKVDAGSYPARYVRMRGTGRSGTYGYSLFELEVR